MKDSFSKNQSMDKSTVSCIKVDNPIKFKKKIIYVLIFSLKNVDISYRCRILNYNNVFILKIKLNCVLAKQAIMQIIVFSTMENNQLNI
jgi:hypothetical protein